MTPLATIADELGTDTGRLRYLIRRYMPTLQPVGPIYVLTTEEADRLRALHKRTPVQPSKGRRKK